MKQLITLLALFVGLTVFAQQHRVGSKVAEYKANRATFHHFSMLTPTTEPADDAVGRAVTKSTLAQLNAEALSTIVANKYQTIKYNVFAFW